MVRHLISIKSRFVPFSSPLLWFLYPTRSTDAPDFTMAFFFSFPLPLYLLMVKNPTPVPEILCIGHWQGQSLWKSCCSLWLEVTPLATYLFSKRYLCFPISYLSNLSRVVQQQFHLSKPEIFWPYNLLPYQVCNKNIYMQLERGKGEWNSDTPGKKKNFWSQSHAILIKMA